ncbi:MAG: thiamine diphosphokinase [Clostridiaceae bacterium]|nr:thiamine diphosphokinase [Clostridiaceae bacterium]
MSRCVIITAYNDYLIKESIEIEKGDFIICADAGYELARRENIVPRVIVGDFDSLESEVNVSGHSLLDVVCLPMEKDDTDTLFCLKYGLEKGFKEFVIVGGFGGRSDHTYANIQTLAYGCAKGVSVRMQDKKNMFTIISNTEIKVPKREKATLSVFAYSDVCTGVSLKGVKYELDDHTLTNRFPLGVSNEFVEDEATISCKSGMLLVTVVADKNT